MSAPSTRWLRPGDHVRVIAPSSPVPRDELERGVARLRARYEVSYDEGLFARDGYLAGDERRRGDELRRALHDPTVRAIIPGRGGYGATRLLDALAPSELGDAPPLLVGFSDITALHALYARAGRVSVHADMVCAVGRRDEDVLDETWLDALEGRALAPLTGLRAFSRGRGEPAGGRLVGGNLAVLHALVGTPYAPPIDGAVLLLEDVNEAPYRIDRMLTTLRQAGWLDRVSGVLLGSFTEAPPNADGVTVEQVLDRAFRGAPYPVLGGAPIGHGHVNTPVRLGTTMVLHPVRGTAEEAAR